MPAFLAPLAITGISALSSWLSNRKKTQQQESTTNSSQTQNVDLYNMPTFSEEQSTGMGVALNNLINQARRGTSIEDYKMAGLRNFGRQNEMRRNLLRQGLASRGLGASPAAAAIEARSEDTAQGGLFDFLNSLPLLQRQMVAEDSNNLLRGVASIPTGSRQFGSTTSTGTSTTKGTATTPGNQLGGLFSGLGQGLASTWGYQDQLNQLAKQFPSLGSV